jgi:hypothetical protein
LHKVSELDEAVVRLDVKIAALCLPFAGVLAIPDQIPGVNQRVAQIIVAEIGLDMSRFKSAAQLASRAGKCPGNHENAGKRKSGKVRKGNRWLRQALVEAAWASSHTKDTSLGATYQRLKGRRGGKSGAIVSGAKVIQGDEDGVSGRVVGIGVNRGTDVGVDGRSHSRTCCRYEGRCTSKPFSHDVDTTVSCPSKITSTMPSSPVQNSSRSCGGSRQA